MDPLKSNPTIGATKLKRNSKIPGERRPTIQCSRQLFLRIPTDTLDKCSVGLGNARKSYPYPGAYQDTVAFANLARNQSAALSSDLPGYILYSRSFHTPLLQIGALANLLESKKKNVLVVNI